MRNNWAFLFMLGFAGVPSARALDSNPPIVLALSEDYPPWSWGKGENVRGLAVELVQAVMEKMQQPVAFQGLPWVRAQKETFRGKFDGLCAANSEERLIHLIPSAMALFEAPLHIYSLNTKEARARVQGVKDPDSLRASSLTFNVYIGAGWVRDHLDPARIQFSQSSESTVRKLATGRGDAVVDNEMVIRYFISKLNLDDQLYEHPPVIDLMRFFLLINRNSPFARELPRFNAAYASFVKTHEYARLVKPYLARPQRPQARSGG